MPDKDVPDYVERLFKAGIMLGDSDGFRLADTITGTETACIINRVLLPKQRQVVEKPAEDPGFEGSGNKENINTGNVKDILESIRPGPSYITDIDKKPETPSKSYTLQKDPATGKYIPFNDPAMVEFIYGTIQDNWSESYKGNYKALYTVGVDYMEEAFGGIDIDWANNNRGGTRSLASTDDYNKLVAGDYISIPNRVNVHMLVAERLDNAIVVVTPTATTFRWKVYTWEQPDVIRQKSNIGVLSWDHYEFNEL